jgi:hypothetical protein
MIGFLKGLFVPTPPKEPGARIVSRFVDELTSNVISRHSEDYQDPIWWTYNYPNNLRETELHEERYDEWITKDFRALEELVENGTVAPRDFNEPYVGRYSERFYKDKTNMEAIQLSARVNRQGHTHFKAKSVLDGYDRLFHLIHDTDPHL